MFRPKNLQRDHPRACGAHKIYATMDRQHKGSSPRMRGSRAAHLHSMRRDGIIPAHAGLTTGSIFQMRKCRDHPRACGAHSVLSAGHQPRLGSSPRMRGSQEHRPLREAKNGSSPRMRGSPNADKSSARGRGIIPAHAGLTDTYCKTVKQIRDHPRACGAHRNSSSGLASSVGIIPAHAGLTLSGCHEAGGHGDHPRACGAHFARSSLPIRDRGSSPRMRGSPAQLADLFFERGIIPAHAGLTKTVEKSSERHRDHPRACGAHIRINRQDIDSKGSSPRMRGSR